MPKGLRSSDSLLVKMWRARLCLILSVTLAGGAWSSGTAQTSSLPELPQLEFESLPTSIRAAVRDAYAAAQPRNASANGELGMVLHAHDLLREAEICYRRAHLLDPTSFQWTYFLGLVQAGLGTWKEAVATLRQALRLDPEYLSAELHLGECLLASGKWQEAATAYEAILRRHPTSALAYYGLGRVRAIRQDLNGAVDAFRKACELFPNFGLAHYGLAQTYRRLGKTDRGLEYLALYHRNKTSVPDEGDPLVDEIRGLNSLPRDLIDRGIELARQGKLEEAVAVHEEALEINPDLIEAHINLISLCGRLGQFAKGEEHFRAAAELNPNDPGNYFNYGLLLAGQNRFPEAEGAFRKTLEIDSRYPGAHLKLGSMLEAQDKLSEAKTQYEKGLENDPKDAWAHFSLGRILVNQENYQEGIQHFLQGLDLSNETSKPFHLYALGAAYARSGDENNGWHYLRLAREKALALGVSNLVESIDEDLRLLESARRPQR